jgi:hypothetical protein
LIGIVQGSVFTNSNDPHADATQMVGYVCSFFNICYYAAPLSSMAEVIRKKDASSLFLPNILVNTLNATLWFSYGLFGLGNIVVYGPSAIGLTLSGIQIALVFIYHEGHWFDAVSGWLTHRTIRAKTRVANETELTVDNNQGLSSKSDKDNLQNERRMSFVVTSEEAAELQQQQLFMAGPRSRKYTASRASSSNSGKMGRQNTSTSISDSHVTSPLTQFPPI